MPEYPVPSLTRKAFTVTSVVIVTVLLVLLLLLVLWRAMELVLMFAAVLVAVLLATMICPPATTDEPGWQGSAATVRLKSTGYVIFT